MKTTGFAFAFAMLSGIACYAGIAWLLPELRPDAYIKVVGFVAAAAVPVSTNTLPSLRRISRL